MLEVIAPIVNKMPIFPEKLKDFINDALELSNKIIEASDVAQKVLPGVEKSLMTADIEQPADIQSRGSKSHPITPKHPPSRLVVTPTIQFDKYQGFCT